MVIYEIVVIISAVLSAGMVGAFVSMSVQILELRKQLFIDRIEYREELKNARETIAAKVVEFDDVTKLASAANQSMGNMLTDMETRLVAIDERISMLQGTATVSGAGVQKSWQAQQRSQPF